MTRDVSSGSAVEMTMRDRYDDTTMFLRCFRDTLRHSLTVCGWRRGWYRAYLWGRLGVEIRQDYRNRSTR